MPPPLLAASAVLGAFRHQCTYTVWADRWSNSQGLLQGFEKIIHKRAKACDTIIISHARHSHHLGNVHSVLWRTLIEIVFSETNRTLFVRRTAHPTLTHPSTGS